MPLHLNYPVFVLANRDGVLVMSKDGDDCIMLFHSRELAQRHIDTNRAIPSASPLHPLPVPNAEALREGLGTLPSDIKCAVWDAAGTPANFVQMGIDELLDAIST